MQKTDRVDPGTEQITMSDTKKVLILERCTKGCGHCEWIMGSPRCTHEDMGQKEPDIEDPCLYIKVPSDSRLFHPDCPLPDYRGAKL